MAGSFCVNEVSKSGGIDQAVAFCSAAECNRPLNAAAGVAASVPPGTGVLTQTFVGVNFRIFSEICCNSC